MAIDRWPDVDAVRVGPRALPGELVLPAQPIGLVVFVHGSGSSRHSPRNRRVAARLQAQRLGSLLFDLLSDEEAQDRRKVFDIALLSQRLIDALDWLGEHGAGPAEEVGARRVGLFGASTGAAAALRVAAQVPGRVGAVVSRGGRGDLAADALPRVQAPTMLIVGGDDAQVLRLNREVLRELRCEKRLEVVPRAGHLFEEPGALDTVADLAAGWFVRHCARVATP